VFCQPWKPLVTASRHGEWLAKLRVSFTRSIAYLRLHMGLNAPSSSTLEVANRLRLRRGSLLAQPPNYAQEGSLATKPSSPHGDSEPCRPGMQSQALGSL
jgi:hypothetical protein